MSEIKNAFDISVLSDGRIEGVLFDIEDTLTDLRTVPSRHSSRCPPKNCKTSRAPYFALLAEGFAVDQAGDYARCMSGELAVLAQRQQRLKRSFALA